MATRQLASPREAPAAMPTELDPFNRYPDVFRAALIGYCCNPAIAADAHVEELAAAAAARVIAGGWDLHPSQRSAEKVVT